VNRSKQETRIRPAWLPSKRGMKTEKQDLNQKSIVKSKLERTCSWPTHWLTRANRKIGKDRIGKGFRADENQSLALDSNQRCHLAGANRAGKTIGLGQLATETEERTKSTKCLLRLDEYDD
jgi:ATPase subunit of ABC transporter with duplicated ATPase domains